VILGRSPFLDVLYNLIVKVFASRLARLVGDLILKTHSAFLKGRQLVDGLVVENEVGDFAKKTRKEFLILKVDFMKAYDPVE
jgi:hypothetical protein